MYYVIFGAFNEFLKESDQAKPFENVDEIDQTDLPNILNCTDFKKSLHTFFMKRLQTVDWILKKYLQEEIDSASNIDFLFVLDDKLSHSFRKKLFPEYKATRKLKKQAFNVQKVKDYIVDVLIPELQLEDKFCYKLVKVQEAEGDDVIAATMRNFNDYMLKVLIASDKDFLQIEGIRQFNLDGKEVKRTIADIEDELTSTEFLLWKIIRGDVSDNIKSCFEKYGDKKSYKLVKDNDTLRKMLTENADARRQFALNKSLIDFTQMPSELNDKIVKEVTTALAGIKRKSCDISVSDLMDL